MLKNKVKISTIVAILVSSSYGGDIIAPNKADIELSGDVELKAVNEKTNSKKVDKRTAEVNLALKANLKNGAKFISEFSAYDDAQAKKDADTKVKTKTAYAVIPILDKKGKVIAGLAPNNSYGTEAFDNGGESWKVAIFMPVAKGVKIGVVSKIENEEEQDKNKGDSGATAIRIDTKVDNFTAGIKYADVYENKGDGKEGADNNISTREDNERDIKVFTGYIKGEISGVEIGAEYISQDVKNVGTNKKQKQKGYYFEAKKKIEKLTAGIAYLNLEKGMKGGDDFAPGVILDGNIESSPEKKTTAISLPIEYAINNKVAIGTTYIDVDDRGVDKNELDFKLTYAMDDNIELAIDYGKLNSDGDDDQTNIEAAIKISF